MITYLKKELYNIGSDPDKYLVEVACLSTDTKPTDDVVTGSLAMEVDTGDIYAFDEVSEDWNKIN